MVIRTGGQSGVDRAALDACIATGMEYAGWCPRGGWAEDHPHPPGLLGPYPKLVPTPSADPDQRTAWNVRDSHAVLILMPDPGNAVPSEAPSGTGAGSPGTSFAKKCADLVFLRPTLTGDPGNGRFRGTAGAWIRTRMAEAGGSDFVLGIGGPRESEVPGIYRTSHDFLVRVFDDIRSGRE